VFSDAIDTLQKTKEQEEEKKQQDDDKPASIMDVIQERIKIREIHV
jgi:hypothetical protein